jgi:diguanylate cyclase (GGDEF)-like protein/PAS domain S-box-containing protein
VLGGALALQEQRRRAALDALAAGERRAREANALFEAGFANAASGLAVVLPDARLLQVNPRMSELTGYTEADLLAHGAAPFWPGARATLEALWHGVLPRVDAEHPFPHPDGTERRLAVGAACVRDADGRPLFVLAQVHDVTARHEAERRAEEARAALAVSTARHEAILGTIDEVVFQASLTGRWRLLSPAFERLTGIPVADALGGAALDLVHPDDQDLHVAQHAQLLVAGDETVVYEHRYTGAAGDERVMHVEAHVTTDPETGGPVISGIMRDVTAVRAAEAAAHRHLENLEVIAEVARTLPTGADARDAIVTAALRVTGAPTALLFERDGDVLRATATSRGDVAPPVLGLEETAGTVTAFTTGAPLFVADARDSDAVSPVLAERFGAASAVFHPVLHDGTPVAVLAVAWSEPIAELSAQHGALLGLLAAEAAVALERADLLARMESMARSDVLTGLPNRREWSERIAAEMSRARRHEYPLCIAVLDIDFFKRVNDTLGHQAGDELLRDAARAWRGALRDVDLLARWGGEEFAVALPACDLDHAMEVVERLRAVMPGTQTCSAGVACWDGRESADAVLARADAALYRAKDHGRDRAERALETPVAV